MVTLLLQNATLDEDTDKITLRFIEQPSSPTESPTIQVEVVLDASTIIPIGQP